MTSNDLRWQIAPEADPAWRQWGDEVVVHHAATNHTHRLVAATGILLAELARRDTAIATAELAGHCALDSEAMEQVLDTLRSLNLVVAC